MMVDSTAKGEAMQALRLLRGYALSHELTQAQIETLYQASRLLEGFIEGAGVLESAIPDVGINPEDVSNVGWISGPTFRKGEYIHVLGFRGKITRIDTVRDNLHIQYDSGDCDVVTFHDARRGNPTGSFTP